MITAKELSGLTVPIVTPLTDSGDIDFNYVEKIVEHVLSAGVHWIFVSGGTGNFCSFTETERAELAKEVIRIVDGRARVMVGCMDATTRLSLRHVEHAAKAGADAVVIEPPFYYLSTNKEVINHYALIARSTEVPVVIYNIPPANKTTIDINLTRELASIPGVIGIKDSTSDFTYWQQLLNAFPGDDFALIQGQETLAGPSLLLGGHGLILAIANVVPHLAMDLYTSAKAGEVERTKRLQRELMRAFQIVDNYKVGEPADHSFDVTVGSFFAGLVAALHELGLCQSVAPLPFNQADESTIHRIREILAGLPPSGIGAQAEPEDSKI